MQPIEASRPDVPYDLISIIERMTAKLPDRRFSSADELAATLQNWLQDETCGQSSRLAVFKSAALRSRQREGGEGSDIGPPSASVDLDLAPIEDSPSPPTISMKLPGAGTHHSKSGDKGAAPAAPDPKDHSEKKAAAAKAASSAAAKAGEAGRINVPSLSPGGGAAVSLADAVALANLPPEPDARLAALAPKRRQRSFWARLAEGIQEKPLFWVEMGDLLLLAIVCVLVIILSLALPTHGIERSELRPAASVHSSASVGSSASAVTN